MQDDNNYLEDEGNYYTDIAFNDDDKTNWDFPINFNSYGIPIDEEGNEVEDDDDYMFKDDFDYQDDDNNDDNYY
jgi:hypothetical protein